MHDEYLTSLNDEVTYWQKLAIHHGETIDGLRRQLSERDQDVLTLLNLLKRAEGEPRCQQGEG